MARQAIERWYRAGERAPWILLGAFVAVWTTFHIVSYASLDLHPDLVEIYAWSRHPALGYYKHPPVGSLIAAAWFSLFPVADWSFHLLAMTNAALALVAVDRINRDYLALDKRLVALLLLLLTPFYQFHGQRFASNQTLLSLWPLATLCFLRAFHTRQIGWSVAAGVAAALAMLGKYYSGFLIAGFGVAALVHPKRWVYLRSPAPWVSVAAGLMVLAPHVYWLATTGWQPFDYATQVHGREPMSAVLVKAGAYALGGVGYVALPIAAWWLLARPPRETLRSAFWPRDPDRAMLVVLLGAPLLLPLVLAPLLGIALTPLWTMSAWFLLPVVLLSPVGMQIPRDRAVALAGAMTALFAVMLIAAPAIAVVNHLKGNREGRQYYALVARELTAAWRARTGAPLRIVGGDADFAAAATFYSPDRPDAVPGLAWRTAPWVTPDRRRREGWAAVCRSSDAGCIATAEAEARREGASEARIAYRAVPRFLGREGAASDFAFILKPPQRS